MPITEHQYWRERRQWAFAHTELWTKGKFITGPIVGIVAFLLQWWLGLRLMSATLQFIATVIAAYFIVALGQFIANWIYYSPVVLERERADEIARQELGIREKDKTIVELTKPIDCPYSELQLTKLARLKQEGQSWLHHNISPNQNQSVARHELETWIKDHRGWRKEIVEILNEKDATIFEAPIAFTNTNVQIPGLPAPYNLDHARSRNQLLGEIRRLEEILREAWGKFLNKQCP